MLSYFQCNHFKVMCVLVLLFFSVSACQPGSQAEPELIGAWLLSGDTLGDGSQLELTVQINQLTPQTDNPAILDGSGCMQSGESGGWAPLSLQAELDAASGVYRLHLISTVTTQELENGVGVIRLSGETQPSGAGPYERATGISRTALGAGQWSAERTSALAVECPAWDAALVLRGEVGVGRDLAYSPPLDVTSLLAETSVVSAQLRVIAPDGIVTLIPYHADIFSFDVDFVNSFLYQGGHEGTPALDASYEFFLLDALGEVIPAIQNEDSFRRCNQGAPVNLRTALVPGDYLEVSWDAPELIAGEFDPENGYGFYQIIIEKYPLPEGGFIYGGESEQTSHRIPWKAFEPGSAGQPDGMDYGIGLSQFADGQFIIKMAAYNFYDAPEGEVGFDCRVEDSRHVLIFSKQGDSLSIQPGGAISGFVRGADGKALSGIAVDYRGAETGAHDRVCSGENGFFLFNHLPLDSYTISAGQFGTEGCDPNSFATVTLPALVLTAETPIQADQNFVLME